MKKYWNAENGFTEWIVEKVQLFNLIEYTLYD